MRLIDRNRFDVVGLAVRSTLGAVRVEKNDVRIRPAPTAFVPLDQPGRRPHRRDLHSRRPSWPRRRSRTSATCGWAPRSVAATAIGNPTAINTTAFASKAKSTILDAHPIDRGDALADHAFVLSKLALAGDGLLLAKSAIALLPPVLSDLEGFAINLSGVQNEVTDNNVLSRNAALDGGVVLQVPSGSVTGNEISVGRVALMVTAKASQGRRDLRVEGNSLAVTGPPPGDGKRTASYALALPTLTAGNYSILDNAMDGSVMIGAEPFASTGLAKQNTLVVGTFVQFAHVLAFDGKSFASARSPRPRRRRSRSPPRRSTRSCCSPSSGRFPPRSCPIRTRTGR